MKIIKDEPMCKHSTMRVGGSADYFVEPENFAECLQTFELCKTENLPLYILGNGSNTLCASSGFRGVVLCTRKLNDVYFSDIKINKFVPYKYMMDRNRQNICKQSLAGKGVCKLNVGMARGKQRNCKSKAHCTLFDLAKKCELPKLKSAIIKKQYLFVRALGGALLARLANIISRRGYRGLEFACGIPASVGGAVKMNAGAFGGQMRDCVFRVLIYNTKTHQVYYKYNLFLDGNLLSLCYKKFCVTDKKLRKYTIKSAKINKKSAFFYIFLQKIDNFIKNGSKKINKKTYRVRAYKKVNSSAIGGCKAVCGGASDKILRGTIKNSLPIVGFDLDLQYRHSSILDEEFIVCVDFVFERGEATEIAKKLQSNTVARMQTQNVGHPSLGSVFKKVGNIAPAKLIDESGLKGLRVGGAEVSRVHAGYIINCGGATSGDIYKLFEIVRRIICKKYNIMLQYEVKFLGEIDEKN